MPGTIAIAAYRTKVLAILDDAAQARYTSTQVDEGMRLALLEYSRARALERTYQFSADGSQRFTMPAPPDLVAYYVYGLTDESTYPPVEYTIYTYVKDETWVVETPQARIPANTNLTLTYAGPHQVDDLDSASGTTVDDTDAELLSLGAAGYAMLHRANSRSEAVTIAGR